MEGARTGTVSFVQRLISPRGTGRHASRNAQLMVDRAPRSLTCTAVSQLRFANRLVTLLAGITSSCKTRAWATLSLRSTNGGTCDSMHALCTCLCWNHCGRARGSSSETCVVRPHSLTRARSDRHMPMRPSLLAAIDVAAMASFAVFACAGARRFRTSDASMHAFDHSPCQRMFPGQCVRTAGRTQRSAARTRAPRLMLYQLPGPA